MTGSNDHLRDEEFDGCLAGGEHDVRVTDHLQSCPDCRAKFARLRELEMILHHKGSGDRRRGPCPPEDVWMHVVGGISDDAAALGWLEHASQCNRCSHLLREATEILNPEISPNEIEALERLRMETAGLPSSGSARSIPVPSQRSPARLWIFNLLVNRRTAITVAAALLLLTSIVTIRWYAAESSPQELLARAYEKKRLTPMRIRGAHYALSAAQRSGGAIPTGELPPELLRASAKAETELELNHDSAYWHAIQGEAYLLENDPVKAIQEYSLSLAYAPGDDEFVLGLGTANCAAAIQNGNGEQYSQGLEYMNRFLRRHPADSVALYNSGICLLRSGMLHQALERLQRAKLEEKDATWKSEIGREIDELEMRLRQESLVWRELERVPGDRQQITELEKATQANASGDPDLALALARRAVDVARRRHDLQDEFNALYEVAYALQRTSRAQDCIAESKPALARLEISRYAEIRTRLVLELGICSNIAGNFHDALKYLTEAASRAANEKSLDVAYRAEGMLAGLLDSEGLHAQAEDLDLAGLAKWLNRQTSPMRAYQFLSDLFFNNVAKRRYFAANDIAQEATTYALLTENATIRSFAFEKLGETCIEIGDQSCAQSSITRALREDTRIAEGPAQRFYHSDWAIQQAQILLNQGRVPEAEKLIDTVGPGVGGRGFMEPFAYQSVLAQLKSARGDSLGAVAMASDAARATVRLRSTMTADRAEFGLLKDARPIFETLVAAEQASGDVVKAFKCWESYRTLLRTESRPCDVRMNLDFLGDASVVSFSRIGSRYQGWILEHGQVQKMGTASDASEVENLVSVFASLCARPNSHESDLRLIGNQIVQALFGNSYEHLITQPGALLIEADAGLRGLPFRALPTPDGEFLGIRKPVALIPGLWVLGPNSLRLPQYSSVGLLSASEHDSSLADSDETRALTFGTAHEQRIVVADFLDASRRLDSADFVYYSGHASEGEVAQVAVSLPRTLRRCRYVVVAACSSGTSLELSSDVYELLPERLLQAGVVGVVATRWNVDSGRTQQLMLNFGKSLTEGANLEVALQQASAELFAAGDRHPFYWAAFDVFGT